ncbi:MAG TPA: AsmA-like C-terminal region-containing protein, partial [Thauera aminoaromatica]|nr:AsmA-like C-terminal region-containing protein [Thauera aminoaromatica]
ALAADELGVFGQTFKAVDLRARADPGGWKARLESDRADGEFDWRAAGKGTLAARFRHLRLVREAGGAQAGADGDSAGDEAVDDPPQRLPALDVVAERFDINELELGRLEVLARNRGNLWQLDRFALVSADGRLAGKGQWRAGARQRTELDFALETASMGGLIRRLGHPDVVRGGAASLAGQLAWRGAPTRIDYPSLSGRLRLETGAGQFNRLEPGVGRLLGILSLQSLPRRITLDFRDVFSEGFAFDRISGSIELARGVLRSEDLEIRGPAARVAMSGSADVVSETQDLRVLVQPTLSESVAIGAAAGLVNPVAGVVTYLAQKVLSDPIEKLFAFEYTVTGAWSDPQVAKRGRAAAPESR